MVGVITTAALDATTAEGAATRDKLMTEESDLGSPARYYNLGLWSGALFRGDTELADRLAGRFSVSFIESVGWPGVLMRYMQGRETEEKLLGSAGENLQRNHVARAVIAMTAKTPERRQEQLQKIFETGYLDLMTAWAHGIRERAKRSGPPA